MIIDNIKHTRSHRKFTEKSINEKEIIFKDKYSMSLEENIFVAKRNLIDYI